ncbi:MAG TPA: murein L,D-transpeptidase catalytic domain family protein [Vicinamibacterales bacterium]|nr:murein L,D-transpeptidase catalytic domain family protein [Vicinamibacterales bacterium]
MSPRAFLTALLLVASLTALNAREAAPALPATLAGALSSASWAPANIGTLQRPVFDLALGAAACAVRSGSIPDLATLTVIDYSRPSTEKRMWVFDLRTRALLYEELVAHGRGSGDNVATSFSNQAESHQSSLGLFRTEDTYVGKNGYSLRLRGLDAGFNDRAFDRAIVIHGAPYVSDTFARAQGRLGRSWGCPALREGIAREVIDTVKGRGLVFAYYPDPAWLAESKYLGDCGL